MRRRIEPATGRLVALQAACRRHGLPLTTQRVVILETIAGRDDHPSADQVYELSRARLPSVSRATVYRVLNTLVRLGLAVKTCTPGSSVRFDPRTERHHHLVCVECERVMDIHVPALDALALPPTEGVCFEVQDYSIHFRGRCETCRRNGKAAGVAGGSTRRAATRAARRDES
jgi:Fur family peroxide stress response transcriptional regulator